MESNTRVDFVPTWAKCPVLLFLQSDSESIPLFQHGNGNRSQNCLHARPFGRSDRTLFPPRDLISGEIRTISKAQSLEPPTLISFYVNFILTARLTARLVTEKLYRNARVDIDPKWTSQRSQRWGKSPWEDTMKKPWEEPHTEDPSPLHYTLLYHTLYLYYTINYRHLPYVNAFLYTKQHTSHLEKGFRKCCMFQPKVQFRMLKFSIFIYLDIYTIGLDLSFIQLFSVSALSWWPNSPLLTRWGNLPWKVHLSNQDVCRRREETTEPRRKLHMDMGRTDTHRAQGPTGDPGAVRRQCFLTCARWCISLLNHLFMSEIIKDGSLWMVLKGYYGELLTFLQRTQI